LYLIKSNIANAEEVHPAHVLALAAFLKKWA